MHQLGFGCVRLSYHLTTKQAIRNLETAYNAGITHFDVARLYGFGAAEGILGKFAKNKRDKITITSKFGIFPGNPIMKNLLIQNIARQIFSVAKKTATKSVSLKAADQLISPRKFGVADAMASLQTSLKELQTDYIDYYLLHEPTVAQANSGELVAFLETQKAKGVVKAFGIGSFTDKIEDDFGKLHPAYTVIQTDNSFPFTTPLLSQTGNEKKLFLFSPFRYYRQIKELLLNDKALQKQIEDISGINVKTDLLDLFLLFQSHISDTATTLFTSQSNKNIQATVYKWNEMQGKEIDTIGLSNISNLLRQRLATGS